MKKDIHYRIHTSIVGISLTILFGLLVAPYLHHHPKYVRGECLLAYDFEDHSKMQVKVLEVETYTYKVKVLVIKDDRDKNQGLEESTMFGPIKLIDKQKDVYQVDCDATVWGNDAGQ